MYPFPPENLVLTLSGNYMNCRINYSTTKAEMILEPRVFIRIQRNAFLQYIQRFVNLH